MQSFSYLRRELLLRMLDERTIQFAIQHRQDDVHRLLLLASQYPDVDMPAAATQIEGWHAARTKIPSWAENDAVVWPSRLSMEQCSSEATARYKATLVGGSTLADLTGGLGVDCAFMSERFEKTIYVERNEQIFAISSANFRALGLSNIHPVCDDALRVLESLPLQDWIYLDPARRSTSGRKVMALDDCDPDVTALEDRLLQHAKQVMIKCSPMLDIHRACQQLRSVQSIHVLALNGECKELLLILGKTPKNPDEMGVFCINLPSDESFFFTRKEEKEATCEFASEPGLYLYEPNAALLKAGCFKLPAQRFGLKKLHPNTQLYTSDILCKDFPGRSFRVVGAEKLSKDIRKSLLAGITQANLTTRNFPTSVDDLRKRLRLAEGGSHYLFATTTNDNRHLLVLCTKA